MNFYIEYPDVDMVTDALELLRQTIETYGCGCVGDEHSNYTVDAVDNLLVNLDKQLRGEK